MEMNPKEIILALHQVVCIRTCIATYIIESWKESKGSQLEYCLQANTGTFLQPFQSTRYIFIN